MVRVFVTGGTGAVGRPTVRQLVARHHEVTALARTPERAAALEAAGATPIIVSLFDRADLAAAMSGHDAVANLATAVPVALLKSATRRGWAQHDRIRSEGARAVAGAAADSGVGRLIQESICFPYVDAGNEWIDEESAWRSEEYSATVNEAEAAAHSHPSGVVLRFAQHYGPDSAHTKLFRRMLRLHLSPLVGRQEDNWSMIHTEDAASAVVAALEAPPGTYNVVDDWPATRRSLASAMGAVEGVQRVHFPPAALAKMSAITRVLTRSLRVSNRKLRGTGWAPSYRSISEGWPTVLEASS